MLIDVDVLPKPIDLPKFLVLWDEGKVSDAEEKGDGIYAEYDVAEEGFGVPRTKNATLQDLTKFTDLYEHLHNKVIPVLGEKLKKGKKYLWELCALYKSPAQTESRSYLPAAFHGHTTGLDITATLIGTTDREALKDPAFNRFPRVVNDKELYETMYKCEGVVATVLDNDEISVVKVKMDKFNWVHLFVLGAVMDMDLGLYTKIELGVPGSAMGTWYRVCSCDFTCFFNPSTKKQQFSRWSINADGTLKGQGYIASSINALNRLMREGKRPSVPGSADGVESICVDKMTFYGIDHTKPNYHIMAKPAPVIMGLNMMGFKDVSDLLPVFQATGPNTSPAKEGYAAKLVHLQSPQLIGAQFEDGSTYTYNHLHLAWAEKQYMDAKDLNMWKVLHTPTVMISNILDACLQNTLRLENLDTHYLSCFPLITPPSFEIIKGFYGGDKKKEEPTQVESREESLKRHEKRLFDFDSAKCDKAIDQLFIQIAMLNRHEGRKTSRFTANGIQGMKDRIKDANWDIVGSIESLKKTFGHNTGFNDSIKTIEEKFQRVASKYPVSVPPPPKAVLHPVSVPSPARKGISLVVHAAISSASIEISNLQQEIRSWEVGMEDPRSPKERIAKMVALQTKIEHHIQILLTSVGPDAKTYIEYQRTYQSWARKVPSADAVPPTKKKPRKV